MLNPVILATRKDLEVLLFDDDEECPLLHGWRFKMAGRELVGLLKGSYYSGLRLTDWLLLKIKACVLTADLNQAWTWNGATT